MDGSKLAGAKLRLKWLPVALAEDAEGVFLGVNGELSRLQKRYSESRSSLEVRMIGGHRSADWFVAVNPIFGWNLSDAPRSGTPDFSLGAKIARRVTTDMSLGIEYYSELGTPAPHRGDLASRRTRCSLCWTSRVPGWDLNLGIGFGLTRAPIDLTLKAIVGFPF